MSSTTAGLSVADLERILDERKSQLQELGKRRDQLHKELEQLDGHIHSLVGMSPRGRRRRKRMKNEGSLRDFVVEILSKNKKGFSLADLEVKVGEAGYKSASKNFRNVLYQCLYNTEGVVHDENTGCYRMEKAQ